jgi:molecular chaperone GrpE (heat shock protein)
MDNVLVLKSLVATLESVREAKIRGSLQEFKPGVRDAKINNITTHELEKIRGYVLPVIDQFERINQVAKKGADDEEQAFSYADSYGNVQEDDAPINLRPFRN